MAYIFHQDDLPRLLSVTPGRERIFFVNQELAETDDLLAGVMYYGDGIASPYHSHRDCEHFYFIIEGSATFESEGEKVDLDAGDLVFIPAEVPHRLRSKASLFYFEFQAPNRFKTEIIEGTDDDLLWERRDGKIWVQS